MEGKNAILVTCGNWDLESMLPRQCRLSGIKQPNFTKSWINVKDEFTRITDKVISREENDLQFMMKHLNLEFSGRLHSGQDDVVNIFKVLKALLEKDKTLLTAEDHSSFVDGRFPQIEDLPKTEGERSTSTEASKVCSNK